MKTRAIGWVLILMSSLVAGMARADIPARDIEYVEVAGMQGLVSEYFGPCQAERFAAGLREGRPEECRPLPDAPRHQCLGGHGLLLHELARLIVEAGKVKRPGVEEFLARINQGGLVRGQLIARNGGDYMTQLSLERDAGQDWLVARHLFKDGRTATWRRPLPTR